MTLDEAIERLKTVKEGWPVTDAENYYLAVELGLAALQRLKKEREGTFTLLLPGETE